MSKLKIQPPALGICDGCHWLMRYEEPFTTAGDLLDEIAPGFRYRRSIRRYVQTDLLRFFGLRVEPVFIGIAGQGQTWFYFRRQVVDQWLDAGGRNWILAELDARSGGRVVAFPADGRRR